MTRLHWPEVDRVRGALLRIVLELDVLRAEARVPVDQGQVAELHAHVVGMIDRLSAIFSGQSRHSLPVFAKGPQSQRAQGATTHG